MGKKDVCPGCSRHCPLDHVRCKYGRKYVEKRGKEQEAAQSADEKSSRKTGRKWEKHVTQGGTAWKLLLTARTLKRALRKEQITEAQLLGSLTPQDLAALDALLDHLNAAIK